MATSFIFHNIRSQTDLWKAKFENGFRDKYCCKTHGLRFVNLFEGFIMFAPE